MSDTDFSLLVELVGALRNADEQPELHAVVEIEGSQGSDLRTCLVEARSNGSTYRTVPNSKNSQFEISFHTSKHETTIVESPDSLIVRENEWRIPVAAPELAMFRPLDLPIWGGLRDTHRITSISRQNKHEIIVGITMLGPDGEDGEEYGMTVNTQLCYVERMVWNYKIYSVKSLKISESTDIWNN